MKNRKLAIVGATLIDGTGSPPVSDSVVLVHGERVEKVGSRAKVPIPSDVELIRAEGRWLLPGLIDLHVHVFHEGFVPLPPKGSMLAYETVIAVNNLRSALQAGITTLRDVSHLDLAVRSAVQRRIILGPRLFSAGKGICMTGGHGSGPPGRMHEVDDPWAVRKAVREEVKEGVDLIKLMSSHRTDNPEFTQEEIDAGVDEAHRHGRKCAIHVANHIGVRMAARAGVDTIEHGSFVDEESADLMAKKGIILVPTLWVKNHIPDRVKKEKEQAAQKGIFNLTEADLEETRIWFERCVEQLPKTMKLVKSKGIRVGTGTDNVFGDQPFAVLPEEIEWLTKYGFSNMEAIQSATRIGAEAIGKEKEFGTVEAGKYADLIMVNRNPLTDIAVLKEVSWVMKEGTVIPLHPEWKRRPITDQQTTL